MKITVKGSKLIEKLQAQRDRAVAKRDEATKFLEEHTKHHKSDPALPALEAQRKRHGGQIVCVFEMQVKALTAHIEGHLRRIDAAIEVIDPNAEVKVSLSKYINSYVESPYDTVTFPPADTADDAGHAQGLMAQGVQKLN